MEFNTTDIYLTTALMVSGVELMGTQKSKTLPTQVVFKLNGANFDIDKLIKEYNNRTLLVEAKIFVEIFKALKQKMFATMNTH